MPKTLFNLTDVDVPRNSGADSYADRSWWMTHPSGMCQVYVWRADGPFTDAPVLLINHGGNYHNPGDRAVQPPTLGANLTQMCIDLSAAGWCVVSIDYPPSPSLIDGASSEKRTHYPASMWPEQHVWHGLAVQYLKRNWSGEAGTLNTTPFGEELWGTGNTINPSAIVSWGGSAGGNAALCSGLIPEGLYAYLSSKVAQNQDVYSAQVSHRPAAVIADVAQVDFTQFFIQTGTDVGTPFAEDIHQGFSRPASGRHWSELPVDVRMAASAHHLLIRTSETGELSTRWIENQRLPLALFWGSSDGGSDGDQLDFTDYQPGRVLDGSLGAGKAFDDPHHWFQGAFGPLAQRWGDPRSIWFAGDATQNPDPLTQFPTTSAAYSLANRTWLQEQVGIAAGV